PVGATGAPGGAGPMGNPGSPGLNALIRTATEPAGENCLFGGVKIEVGLDEDSSDVLENSEVDAAQTQYVCTTQPTGSSCKSILESNPSAPSGVYQINPDGSGRGI